MQNTNSRRKLLPTPHMEWKVCCTCRGILFISDDLSRAVLAKGEKKKGNTIRSRPGTRNDIVHTILEDVRI